MINIEKIIEIRKWLWFSQTEIADKTGLTLQTIYRYESWTTISIESLMKIIDIFNEGRRKWEFFCKSDIEYTISDFITK